MASERLELDVSSIHEKHVDFVWRSLQRLGVREGDLDDMTQEVFCVVHRRLHTFDGQSQMTTWLFGICMRIAAGYRRRAYFRWERLTGRVDDDRQSEAPGPEEEAAARQARARLEALLDELDLEKRAVFVMFEIDGLPCEEIAGIVGVPIGTVHSRLHAARKAFEKAIARVRARHARGGAR